MHLKMYLLVIIIHCNDDDNNMLGIGTKCLNNNKRPTNND